MNIIKRIWQRLQFMITGNFLCDTCRYDYGDACRKSVRPNAKICEDYRK